MPKASCIDKFLVDTHTHIEGKEFLHDRDLVLARARKAGVRVFVNPAYDMASSIEAVALSCDEPDVYACVGFHPSDSSGYTEQSEAALIELAKSKKVKAIGEIGLDYHYDNVDKVVQKRVFERQIDLARTLDLPIVIHSRDADKDTFDILLENKAFDLGVLMHCYGSSLDMAREYVKRGAILGIGGVLTFKNARKLVEVVQGIDLKHLVLETDAPYLAPSPYRGKRNEPSYIRLVAEKLAEIKGLSYEEVLEQTSETALGFYGIDALSIVR